MDQRTRHKFYTISMCRNCGYKLKIICSNRHARKPCQEQPVIAQDAGFILLVCEIVASAFEFSKATLADASPQIPPLVYTTDILPCCFNGIRTQRPRSRFPCANTGLRTNRRFQRKLSRCGTFIYNILIWIGLHLFCYQVLEPRLRIQDNSNDEICKQVLSR